MTNDVYIKLSVREADGLWGAHGPGTAVCTLFPFW